MAIQNYHAELLNAISDAKKGLSSSITLNVNVVSGDPKVLDNALSQWSRFITHTYSKTKGCKGTLDFRFERNAPGKKDIDLSAVKSTHTLSDVILLISEQLGLGRNYGGFGRADRIVITLMGVLLASLQVFFEIQDPNWLGIDWNPMILIIFISLIGGIYTFFSRFFAAIGDLKELDKQEPLTNTKSTSPVDE